jgi:hypothetical protein
VRRLERRVAIGVEHSGASGTVGADGATARRRFAFFGGGVAGRPWPLVLGRPLGARAPRVPGLGGKWKCGEPALPAVSVARSSGASGWSSRLLAASGRRSERCEAGLTGLSDVGQEGKRATGGWGCGRGQGLGGGRPAEVAQLSDEERHEGPARALLAEDLMEAVDNLLVECGAQDLACRRILAAQ